MIERIKTNEPAVIQRLVELELEAFGAGGLNQWHLIPVIRHGKVFILRKELEIVGSVQYIVDWDNRRKAYVIGVSIAKEWRGRNLGTELLAGSLDALSYEDISEVELTVGSENLAAIRIYEKLGFERAGFLHDEYGPGEDRLVMVKALTLK